MKTVKQKRETIKGVDYRKECPIILMLEKKNREDDTANGHPSRFWFGMRKFGLAAITSLSYLLH